MSSTLATTGLACLLFAEVAHAEPVPVQVVQTDGAWELRRDGKPYLIRGAGGTGSLEKLAAAGANSLRTWGIDDTTGDLLNRAHRLGLTVTIGIWLGHERHGFDYDDPAAVAKQLATARDAVLAHRDHPALLMWGVGNEMEGFAEGDNPKIWAAVNEVAAMIKEIDPLHPTMTITAELGGARVASVRDLCPAVDVHGINAYGGGASIPARYRELGGQKPYVLTEYGPPGAWETGKADWGAPYEATSTQKAEAYANTWERGILGAPGLSLGGYAFTWGFKMEATATWFGLFLPNGNTLNAVDTLTELWSGSPPTDLSPAVTPLTIVGATQRKPGAEIDVSWTVTDPEGAPVSVTWALRRESGEYLTGGDTRPMIPNIPDAILRSTPQNARVRLPEFPGPYRLFATATDTSGHAATANVPVLVTGESRTPLPMSVYEDSPADSPWAPSGWMGNTQGLAFNGEYQTGCHQHNCLEIIYSAKDQWAGVAWQNPPNNWGDAEGGLDLTGAKALEFWARGAEGGEHISVSMGLIESGKPHPDSAIVGREGVVLKSTWKRYRIPLRGEDLSSIKTAFVVTLAGRGRPKVVYLDGIRFID
ncbi:MAG: glycoside hydrolase family 2 TIM barrel-domain containing protein [Myxococcota bacterium]